MWTSVGIFQVWTLFVILRRNFVLFDFLRFDFLRSYQYVPLNYATDYNARRLKEGKEVAVP